MFRRLIVIFSGRSFGRARRLPRGAFLSGYAKTIDGDTIEVAGTRIRLHGIDAPELDQTYLCWGQPQACGMMAMAALEALTAGIKLRCEVVAHDRHGRPVARCYSPAGVDVGQRLVAAGWALAYRRYSHDYVAAENTARKARRGMWRGSFQEPEVWRIACRKRRASVALDLNDVAYIRGGRGKD